MAGVVQEKRSLAQIARREVALYAGECGNCTLYSLLDDEHLTYAVVTVAENDRSA
jgi:hypothetical protein